MQTETVTYLKENANKLELDEPLVVTKNGKAKFVIQDYEEYEQQRESMALLKLLVLSSQSHQDREISLDEALED